jgi:hypothetical protein
MKTYLILLLAAFAVVFTGCSSPNSTGSIDNNVAQADRDWSEYKARQVPKPFVAGRVDLERRVYAKALARRGEIPEWRVREAGWKYVIAVNAALCPDAPLPPGKGSVANHPFIEGTTLK